MNKDLQIALDQCSSAVAVITALSDTYENVLTAKMDLENACMALERWLEEHAPCELVIHQPDCSACFYGLKHTEHDQAGKV